MWPSVKLGKVISHRKEFITIDGTREYKRCRVQLHANGIVLRDLVTGALIKTKQQQVCRGGEFLVAEIDAKVGGFGIVPDELDGAIVSSHYFLFMINNQKLDTNFLGYYVKTPFFREQVNAQGSTNYAAIRPSHVLDYEIPLPPLSEQRRIVTKIKRLAAKVEIARILQHKSNVEVEALFHSNTRNVFEDVRNCKAVVLEDVCSQIIDCLHSNPVYADSGIPTLRSPDIGWGKLYLETSRKTSEEEYRRRTQRGELHAGDIVLVREGGGTGKAGIVEEGQRLSLGQRVMQLRPDKKRILPRFLLHQWLSSLIQDQIANCMKGSASPHLNIGALRKFQFLLPSLEEQKRIVLRLDNSQSKIDHLKDIQLEIKKELDVMLPSILDRAFKGEL